MMCYRQILYKFQCEPAYYNYNVGFTPSSYIHTSSNADFLLVRGNSQTQSVSSKGITLHA